MTGHKITGQDKILLLGDIIFYVGKSKRCFGIFDTMYRVQKVVRDLVSNKNL